MRQERVLFSPPDDWQQETEGKTTIMGANLPLSGQRPDTAECNRKSQH
jgi:hypothetical protein